MSTSYWSPSEVADAIRILEHAVEVGTGTLPAAAALGLANTGAEGLAVAAATAEDYIKYTEAARRARAAARLRTGWQPTG